MKLDYDLRYANLPSISGGDGTEDPPEDPQAPPAGDPPAPPVDPEPLSDAQQLHVNSIVKRESEKAVKAALKAIADEQAEANKKADQEREAAARKLLKSQGKLEELNEDLTKENERLQAEVDRMTTELADFHKDIESEYTTFRASMPPALAVFDVGESASPSAKRDFVSKGRQMIADLGAPFRHPAGPDPNPRPPVDLPGDEDPELDEEVHTLVTSNRQYNRF